MLFRSGGAGLAQNEMKAKPVLPERVRSMEGLGRTREHIWPRRLAHFTRHLSLTVYFFNGDDGIL